MAKKIVVIGAGLAGLAAASYGRRNGFEVEVFEQAERPGGLCTSWQRQGYTINGGLAFLAGSGPSLGFHRLWRELGVVPTIRMIEYDQLIVIENREGKSVHFYSDLEKLNAHLLQIAPEDSRTIRSFIHCLRTFCRFDLPVDKAMELLSIREKMKILVSHFPLLTAMTRWRGITINRFVAGLKNPLLRDAFASFNKLGLSADLPMLALVMFLAWSIQKSAGFPEGGGLEMIRAIESHLLTLGGRIRYRARVEKIMVENGHASGIRLVDGSEVRADFVISAADGKTTVFNLLEGKYLDQRRRLFYEKTPVAPAVTILAFGVKRIFNDLPHSTLGYVFPLAKPETIGGIEQTVLRPMVYNFDPSLSPADRTLIRLFIPSDYDFWQGLGYQSERYYSEKKRLAATVISLLEQRFPGISQQLEMQDVATPLTFERYTGNHRGSIMGWAADGKSLMQPLPKTLPGLRHFYLAGQWAEIGAGVPGSAMSGRSAIQHICRSEKKDFISVIPGQAGLAIENGNG